MKGEIPRIVHISRTTFTPCIINLSQNIKISQSGRWYFLIFLLLFHLKVEGEGHALVIVTWIFFNKDEHVSDILSEVKQKS